MNGDRDLPGKQPQDLGRRPVDDGVDDLNFQEMVAGTQGAELVAAALQGPLRQQVGIGAVNASALLDMPEILLPAQTAAHHPGGSFAQHLVLFGHGQAQIATMGTDPRRDVAQQCIGQFRQARPNVCHLQLRSQQAHAAIDIVTYPPGGNHPLVRIEGGDTADGKSVAPMDVGHTQGRPDDARQHGDVAYLLQGLFTAQHFHHGGTGVHQAFGPHGAFPRDAPAAGINLLNRNAHGLLSPECLRPPEVTGRGRPARAIPDGSAAHRADGR